MKLADLAKEIQTLKSLHHERLIRLHAVCSVGEPVYLVTELMRKGSLQAFLGSECGPSCGLCVATPPWPRGQTPARLSAGPLSLKLNFQRPRGCGGLWPAVGSGSPVWARPGLVEGQSERGSGLGGGQVGAGPSGSPAPARGLRGPSSAPVSPTPAGPSGLPRSSLPRAVPGAAVPAAGLAGELSSPVSRMGHRRHRGVSPGRRQPPDGWPSPQAPRAGP